MNRRVIAGLVLVVPWAILGAVAQAPKAAPERAEERIQQEVRHQILMLPFYTVFDNITFKVEGYKVTLMGQVSRPSLKADAESVVKRACKQFDVLHRSYGRNAMRQSGISRYRNAHPLIALC